MQQRLQNSTTHPIPFLLVSSTDHTTGVTGLGSTPTVLLSKDGGAFAAAAGAVSEIGDGWYVLAANATDRNTLGALLIHATGTGADPYDDACEIVGYDPFNSTNLGLSALVTPPTVAQIATQIFTDTTETDFQSPMTPGWILRLMREALLGSLAIPTVPGQWRCVLDDNFQHADTSPGSAGSTTGVPTQPLFGELVSWQDINGNVWSISGNTLSNNAFNGSGFTTEFLLRTDTAGRAVNQRMILNSATTAGHFGVVLRWVDSNNFYYLAFSAVAPDWTIEKVVAGVQTTLGASTINAITAGHALEITMQAVGINPTTLSIQVIDLTAGICVLSFQDSTCTDSSSALQISSGVVGLDNGNSAQTNLTRVRGYVGLQTSDAPGWYTAPDNTDIGTLVTSVGAGLGTLVSAIKAQTDKLVFDGSGYVKSDPQTNVTVGGYATHQDPAYLVLDAQTSAHNGAGTIGLAIGSGGGGGGGDPWATSEPGSYASGTFGYLVSHTLSAFVGAPGTTAVTQSAGGTNRTAADMTIKDLGGNVLTGALLTAYTSSAYASNAATATALDQAVTVNGQWTLNLPTGIGQCTVVVQYAGDKSTTLSVTV